MRRVPPARRKSSQYAQSPSSIQKVQPSCSKSSEHLQPAYKIPGSARVSSSGYRARCLRAVNVAVFAPDVTSGASPPAHRDWCQGTERAEPDLCVKHLNGGFFFRKQTLFTYSSPKKKLVRHQSSLWRRQVLHVSNNMYMHTSMPWYCTMAF